MRFSVPQFIEIEDKIFGPLTFKQFAYVIGGIGSAFVFYYTMPLFLAIMFIIPVCGLAFLFAFKPIHGRPFSVLFEAGFKYLMGGKLYLWRKTKKPPEKQKKISLNQTVVPTESAIPRVSEGKLDHMSWSLDVKEKPKPSRL